MTYAKGAHYERDLIEFLKERGFSAVRIAGSGHKAPADILAIRKGLVLAIESKAHAQKPYLPRDRVAEFTQWCEQAGALGFLAWRAPHQEWRFLPLKSLIESNFDDEFWLTKETLLRAIL